MGVVSTAKAQLIFRTFFGLLLGTLLTSCALTTPEAFYQNAPETWDHRQRMVAFFYALQKEATVDTPSGKAVNRSLVSVEEAYDLVLRMRKDLEWALKNPNYVDYLLWTGSNVSATKTDGVWLALQKCLSAYYIKDEFARAMGLSFGESRTPYEAKLVLACPQLARSFEFLDKRIEQALKEGRLVPSQIVTLDLVYPEGALTLHAKTFIVIPDTPKTPEESFTRWFAPGVYAEVYRGEEEVPIVRLFRPPTATFMTIALIDYDNPDILGYGLPDEIMKISSTSALDFISVHVRKLFPKNDVYLTLYNHQRKPLNPEEVYVVRTGSREHEVWEVGEFEPPSGYDGYGVPVHVYFRYVREKEPARDGTRLIDYFGVRYPQAKVEEIYKPKPENARVTFASVYGQNVALSFKDKPKVEAPPKALGVLTYIVYASEGDKSMMLWDSDGDGKFDRRRSVTWDWENNYFSW